MRPQFGVANVKITLLYQFVNSWRAMADSDEHYAYAIAL